jgi:hypothetical protein
MCQYDRPLSNLTQRKENLTSSSNYYDWSTATGWFDIVQSETKTADLVANKVEIAWLSRYPWPTKITYHHGSEFIGSKFQPLILQEYDIEAKPSSKRNPQSNAILERIHQTIGNMGVCTFEVEINQDENDPWSRILSAVTWEVCAMYHTMSNSPTNKGGRWVTGGLHCVRVYIVIFYSIY